MKASCASCQTGCIGQVCSREQLPSPARHLVIAIGPSISSITSLRVIELASASRRTPPPGPLTPTTHPCAPNCAMIWGKKLTGISCLLAMTLEEINSPGCCANSTKALIAYSDFLVTSTYFSPSSSAKILQHAKKMCCAGNFLACLLTRIILMSRTSVKKDNPCLALLIC